MTRFEPRNLLDPDIFFEKSARANKKALDSKIVQNHQTAHYIMTQWEKLKLNDEGL